MDFIDSLGPAFLAHRLRRLHDVLVEQVGEALSLERLTVPPRSLSTLLLLEAEGPMGPVDLSRRLRFSHPLMIRALRILDRLGLVQAVDDPSDQRRRMVELTALGRSEAVALRGFQHRLSAVIDHAASEAGGNADALLAQISSLSDCLLHRPITNRLATKVPV